MQAPPRGGLDSDALLGGRCAAVLWVALVVAAGLVGAGEEGRPGTGAMNFSASALDGRRFVGSELAGKAVLLDFWAVWCAPCITAFPGLNRLQADFGGSDFTVLGVASYSGSAADVEAFLREYSVNYPMIVADEELVERFGVIGYPTYFLVGPGGSVYRQYVGEMPDLYDAVKSDLELLAQASASRPEVATHTKREVS